MASQIASVVCAASLSLTIAAGDLNPPGPPAGTAPLSEPRTPITSLPLTITEPGSYFLTRSFTVAGSTAITVSAAHVMIDLNGFSLKAGDKAETHGIELDSAAKGAVISNGVIASFGGAGISGSSASHLRVSGVAVFDCGASGIVAGSYSLVERSSAARCGFYGIFLLSDGQAIQCIAERNEQNGFVANSNCLFRDCISTGNGASGYRVSSNCSLTGCLAQGNAAFGIDAFNGQTVVFNCTAEDNDTTGIIASSNSRIQGCIASRNGLHGIELSGVNSVVADNACYNNGRSGPGAGIELPINAWFNRVEGNHMVYNDVGIEVLDKGNLIVRNSACANPGIGPLNNYSIAATSSYGEITSGGANFNVSAWANFSTAFD